MGTVFCRSMENSVSPRAPMQSRETKGIRGLICWIGERGKVMEKRAGNFDRLALDARPRS
jgi:hypothetical protein